MYAISLFPSRAAKCSGLNYLKKGFHCEKLRNDSGLHNMKRVLAVIIACIMLLFAACSAGGRRVIASKDVESAETGIIKQSMDICWEDEETIKSLRYSYTFSDEATAKAAYDELTEAIGDEESYALEIKGAVVSYNELITDATAARPYSSLYGQLTAEGWTIEVK